MEKKTSILERKKEDFSFFHDYVDKSHTYTHTHTHKLELNLDVQEVEEDHTKIKCVSTQETI